eukprot:12925001-Alexandrium_andersonii.AAC.1
MLRTGIASETLPDGDGASWEARASTAAGGQYRLCWCAGSPWNESAALGADLGMRGASPVRVAHERRRRQQQNEQQQQQQQQQQ